ncbi:DUF5958 family protein [Streptomyces sp. NPDC050636]|uniref:DUF5958 family protein n=1 Tax=Streptomyces sp. NPDC050636 TaxID=3154510 RepID=UPI0034169589
MASYGRKITVPPLTTRLATPRAFRLPVALLAVADTRRRERYRADGCGNEWHRLAARPDAGPAVT